MNKPRVSPGQAKMLKSVGYDVPDTHSFSDHKVKGVFEEVVDDKPQNYNGKYRWFYTRPTLDDAARWLREKKGWHVIVMPDDFGVSNDLTWTCAVYQIIEKMNPQPMVLRIKSSMISHYPDHDTALSEGITLILKKETDGQ